MIVSPEDFNDKKLEEMKATIYVESGIFSILGQSNVGLGNCGIKEGLNVYSYSEAVLIIRKIDSIFPYSPKYLQKRIRAQRMSFILAFGPEMEAFILCSEEK